jgi:hypothetical protein
MGKTFTFTVYAQVNKLPVEIGRKARIWTPSKKQGCKRKPVKKTAHVAASYGIGRTDGNVRPTTDPFEKDD